LHFPAPKRAHFTPGYRLLKAKLCGAKNARFTSQKDRGKKQRTAMPLGDP